MPRTPKEPKTREQWVQSGIRMYKNLPQYRHKIAIGEMTADDIRFMAEEWADKKIREKIKDVDQKKLDAEAIKSDDERYREKQRRAYRQAFDWNNANDEASLDQLLDLELQIRAIRRDMEKASDYKSKNSYRNALTKAIAEHRNLQKDLQIDRSSREKKRSATNVIDDWDRIKVDAAKKIEELNSEFAEMASEVKTEAELRDRIKFHGVIPFDMVDQILINHRRVLGLDTTIEKS